MQLKGGLKRIGFFKNRENSFSYKTKRFNRNFTISNDDIKKEYRFLKHNLSLYKINEGKEYILYDKTHAFYQQIFYNVKKLSRMETVYNEEEKKLILKKFQKSTRDLLKDKKNELGEIKIKKLQDLQEKYKIEGKNELLEKVTQEIELLKKEQEYLSQNEVEEEIQEKKQKRSAVLKDEDTSDETAEKNENISEEKLEKNIKSLEKILQKDIISEEDLKIILDEDEEMKLEFDILQEMCDDLDKDDPIRKMENLNYSKEPSYKNIVERKKEFDIRFESYFQRKDGENVSFDFQEKEFWTEIDTLGDKIEEETLKKAQPQGYVKLLRQKQILEECIKTAKDPDFQEFAETYVFSEDRYRIDCGLMIQRPPIFVKYIVYLTSVNDEDMKFLKTRRDFFKKYHYDFDKISPEIDNFNDYNIDYWDNVKNDVRSNNDNDTNLRKWNKETNKYDFYSPNSKNWKLVDPNMKDNKSIQYNGINRVYMLFKNKHTGKWEFPTLPLRWGENFNQRRQMLQYVISRDLFKVHFATDEPSLQITRDMFSHEEKENNFINFNGVRTYYFPAFHFRGQVHIHINDQHDYIDYVFASKKEMNKYLDEGYYKAIIGSLEEY